MKLTFEKIKEEMKKGEVILEDTNGLLRRVLVFTATNGLKMVTEVVSEESVSYGSVYSWYEEAIEDWTIKQNAKKYWLWAYEKHEHTPLISTDMLYDDDFRSTTGVYFSVLAKSHFKTKLLHTEVEI